MDIDFYVGFDGMGPECVACTISSDIMLGYGLVDRFSLYAGATLQGNELFGDGQAAISLGVFGTPVDTDHFDLDLFLETSVGGSGLSELQVTPSLEINLDVLSDRRSWGAYFRAGIPVFHRAGESDASNVAADTTAFSVVLNPGIYATIAERHQLLLEYDMTFHQRSADEHFVDVGGVAIGYNAQLHDSIELISQVYFDIPQHGESIAFGVMLGFIATLPSAR
jgi:hypothetical protein